MEANVRILISIYWWSVQLRAWTEPAWGDLEKTLSCRVCLQPIQFVQNTQYTHTLCCVVLTNYLPTHAHMYTIRQLCISSSSPWRFDVWRHTSPASWWIMGIQRLPERSRIYNAAANENADLRSRDKLEMKKAEKWKVKSVIVRCRLQGKREEKTEKENVHITTVLSYSDAALLTAHPRANQITHTSSHARCSHQQNIFT